MGEAERTAPRIEGVPQRISQLYDLALSPAEKLMPWVLLGIEKDEWEALVGHNVMAAFEMMHNEFGDRAEGPAKPLQPHEMGAVLTGEFHTGFVLGFLAAVDKLGTPRAPRMTGAPDA